MSKKLYQLIVGITGGLSAIAIGETAVAEICNLFVKEK